MLIQNPSFYETLAADCALSADRAQSVINEIQRQCVESGLPSYMFSRDMQDLTTAVITMERLSKQYRAFAALSR
jgi:hypothetical protein